MSVMKAGTTGPGNVFQAGKGIDCDFFLTLEPAVFSADFINKLF